MELRKTYKAATKEKDCIGTCSCCVEREGKEIQMCCIGVEEGSEQCTETKKNVIENNYPKIGFCSTCKAVLHSGGHSLCSDCVSKVREYEKKISLRGRYRAVRGARAQKYHHGKRNDRR